MKNDFEGKTYGITLVSIEIKENLRWGILLRFDINQY